MKVLKAKVFFVFFCIQLIIVQAWTHRYTDSVNAARTHLQHKHRTCCAFMWRHSRRAGEINILQLYLHTACQINNLRIITGHKSVDFLCCWLILNWTLFKQTTEMSIFSFFYLSIIYSKSIIDLCIPYDGDTTPYTCHPMTNPTKVLLFNGRISGSEHEVRDHRISWPRSDVDRRRAAICRRWWGCPWFLSWMLRLHLQSKEETNCKVLVHLGNTPDTSTQGGEGAFWNTVFPLINVRPIVNGPSDSWLFVPQSLIETPKLHVKQVFIRENMVPEVDFTKPCAMYVLVNPC